MKAGILFNRNSPLPKENLLSLGEKIQGLVKGGEIVIHRGYGEGYVKSPGKIIPADRDEGDYKRALRTAVERLAGEDIDVLVTVGGDGLASYAADVIIRCRAKGRNIPMLGIAAGTANVGPVVSFSGDELEGLRWEDLESIDVDGVEVSDDGLHLGYGFNDIVLGDTFLATVGGETKNISVTAMVSDNTSQVKTPGTNMVSRDFSVRLGEKTIPLGEGPEGIRQIIVSPLQFDRRYGRAVMGALCCGEGPGLAALALAGRVIVDSDPGSWEEPSFVTVRHLLFNKDELLSLRGLGEDAHIVIDGNPFIRRGDVLYFRSAAGAVSVLKKRKEG